MAQLKRFLKQSKDFLNNLSQISLPYKVHVCIGNQACDADSMISSICYAYYKELTATESAQPRTQYLPIMAIMRNDIQFRREVKIILDLLQISFDDLICFDECPLNEFNQEDLSLTLMDHNYLSLLLHSSYSTRVTEIIDHHADQGYYPSVQGSDRFIAFNTEIGKADVGSACTLVAERFSQANLLDPQVATLLLGVISVE
jgi:inorganic pyrophosphatase/exopolyphosphatase